MDQTSKYAAMRITSRKNISSSQETLTPAEIRSRRRIICSTPNITSDLLPLRRLHRRSHRAVSSGRLERMRTTWRTTAILARCRIVSPRPRSGRPLIRSRSRDFNLNRAPRRTPRSRSPTDRLTRPSVRAATIEEALRPGRIVRATDFRTEARDPIALPGPQRGLSRQSTWTRWSPAGFPALSRSSAARGKPAADAAARRAFHPS